MEELFKGNPLLQGGLLLGILAYLGNLLKNVPNQIYKLLYRKVVYNVHVHESSTLYFYVEQWLKFHHIDQYKNVMAGIKSGKLEYDHKSDIFYIKYKNKWLKISKNQEKLQHARDIFTIFDNSFTISGIKAKDKIDSLLKEVYQFYLDAIKVGQTTDLYFYNTSWSWLGPLDIKGIDNVMLKGKKSLVDDLDLFMNSEDWYRKRSIPYRRGYLFYGLPGNGKTTTALSIAKYLKRNIAVINLNGMTDAKLIEAFQHIPERSVLLLEDIDCAYVKRDGDKKDMFSFSTLLNCLDGVFSKPKMILIFTTNHINKLDGALIRDGRVDYKLEITNPDTQFISEYLSLFYEFPIVLDFECHNKLDMVSIQNICIQNQTNHLNAINEIKNKL